MATDFSRRRFLQYSGAAAIATTMTTLTGQEVAQAMLMRPLQVGTPILVVVTLYGGNDGLNTVVPYEDPIYSSSRPGISLSASEVLPIGNGLALNGSMTAMKALWDAQKLAIVLGVSYPQPNHSHFSSMAIWQSASPVEQISSGWIGRWLDTQVHDPMLAIGIGSVLTPLLAGDHQVGSMLPVGGLMVPTGTLATELQQMAQVPSTEPALVVDAGSSINDLFEVALSVAPALKTPTTTSNPLAAQLSIVAQLINANVPTRVWSATLNGFDTHADEVKQQSNLLGQVSDAVSGFLGQLSAARANDVIVMVYSEFGRRVVANASLGTDHGTSAPVFIAGNRVAGGFYGEQPSLSQLVSGDLAVTTDFRDVYASMLADVISGDPTQIMNGWPTKLNLVTPV